jgi:hypothetical protein
MNPGYAEARINLGDTIWEMGGGNAADDARSQYAAVLLLQVTQLQRAAIAMREHGLVSLSVAGVDESMCKGMGTTGRLIR